MKISLILISFVVCTSVFAVSRVKNPCWNTRLSSSMKKVCKVCEARAERQSRKSCIWQRFAVTTCLADFENCVNYSDLLVKRDNCKTNLVKKCFNRHH